MEGECWVLAPEPWRLPGKVLGSSVTMARKGGLGAFVPNHFKAEGSHSVHGQCVSISLASERGMWGWPPAPPFEEWVGDAIAVLLAGLHPLRTVYPKRYYLAVSC
jgi:hypothetical protein